jgi:hypothetical protein
VSTRSLMRETQVACAAVAAASGSPAAASGEAFWRGRAAGSTSWSGRRPELDEMLRQEGVIGGKPPCGALRPLGWRLRHSPQPLGRSVTAWSSWG